MVTIAAPEPSVAQANGLTDCASSQMAASCNGPPLNHAALIEADFNRPGESFGNLYISGVEHKTYLSIDEKGAEGAAVTAVGIGVTSLPPVINFNRSFMFILRDTRYNTVLFIGKIDDPSA